MAMKAQKLAQQSVPQKDKYLIIDTHGGAEDIFGIVMAIRLAQKYHKVVLGITCVAGRRGLDEAVKDALVAQKITNTSYPVFKGSKQSILLNKSYPQCINFGEQSEVLSQLHLQGIDQALVQDKSAIHFIADSIRQHGKELSIIAFGPATNLALAYHEAQSHKEVSSVRLNGGAYTAVGNVVGSNGSEGNFMFDPQGAQITISNYSEVYICPLEVSLEHDFRPFLTQLKAVQSNEHSKIIIDLILKQQYAVCGPLLTLLPTFKTSIIDSVLHVYAEVVNQGNQIRGLMVCNWLRLDVKPGEMAENVRIYSDINKQALRTIERSLLE